MTCFNGTRLRRERRLEHATDASPCDVRRRYVDADMLERNPQVEPRAHVGRHQRHHPRGQFGRDMRVGGRLVEGAGGDDPLRRCASGTAPPARPSRACRAGRSADNKPRSDRRAAPYRRRGSRSAGASCWCRCPASTGRTRRGRSPWRGTGRSRRSAARDRRCARPPRAPRRRSSRAARRRCRRTRSALTRRAGSVGRRIEIAQRGGGFHDHGKFVATDPERAVRRRGTGDALAATRNRQSPA